MSQPIPRSKPSSTRCTRVSRRGLWAGWVLVFGLLFAGPALAEPEYNSSDSGHPVRIAGYVLHPVGVIYDYLLLRPAWWVGSYEPFRTLFGRVD